MNLGIIQGRLSEPKEGFQECPAKWDREFNLLHSLGLSHIEWIITADHFATNPLFHANLKGYPISSVCADFMVHPKFYDINYLNRFLRPTCEAASLHDLSCITIPLLEDSDVNENNIRKKFIDALYPYVEEFKNLTFLIEAELHQDKLKKILDIASNIMVTYDTGNITSCSFDHSNYISELAEHISQVHLKDRTVNPLQTVEPPNGDTDFKLIFSLLKSIGFKGSYTLQTARGITGKEIKTITSHKKIIEDIYNE